jgi:hypothetical protein
MDRRRSSLVAARSSVEAVLEAEKEEDVLQLSHAQEDQIIRIFNDCDSDGSGTIEIDELEAICEGVNNHLTMDEMNLIMEQLDMTGNGESVEFDDFIRWWQYGSRAVLALKELHLKHKREAEERARRRAERRKKLAEKKKRPRRRVVKKKKKVEAPKVAVEAVVTQPVVSIPGTPDPILQPVPMAAGAADTAVVVETLDAAAPAVVAEPVPVQAVDAGSGKEDAVSAAAPVAEDTPRTKAKKKIVKKKKVVKKVKKTPTPPPADPPPSIPGAADDPPV